MCVCACVRLCVCVCQWIFLRVYILSIYWTICSCKQTIYITHIILLYTVYHSWFICVYAFRLPCQWLRGQPWFTRLKHTLRLLLSPWHSWRSAPASCKVGCKRRNNPLWKVIEYSIVMHCRTVSSQRFVRVCMQVVKHVHTHTITHIYIYIYLSLSIYIYIYISIYIYWSYIYIYWYWYQYDIYIWYIYIYCLLILNMI